MTAADLSFSTRSVSSQADFIARRAASEVKSRPTLRIANPADGMARHGMFLGTGAVTAAVRFCQDAVHRAGLAGNWAAFATLSAAVSRAVFSRRGEDDSGRIDRPHPISMRAGSQTVAEGAQLLLLASTLDRLILGTRPFWGGKTGPLRVMVVPHPVPSIVRWLLPLMYGGETRATPPGAVSWSGESFSVETPSPFVLDGEFFDPPAGSPLRVEGGPSFSYIRR
jgi:hypothetical protein